MKGISIDRRLYHGLFLILAILSVYFYKERLFVDSSYMIFKTINKGWFHIEHGRPAHALTQLLPLLGYALHLPLKVLLILYSLGQVLFFYALFLLFDKVFHSKAAIIALLGIVLIGQSWLYYVAMLEIVMGAVLAVLCLLIMQSDRWKSDGWKLVLYFSFWMVLSSHPLNYLLALVLILFDILKRSWRKELHLPMIFLFFAALFVEWLGHDDYEAQKFVGIADSGLMQLASFSFLKESIGLLLQKYWSVIILGISSSVIFARKGKRYLSMIWPYALVLLYLAAVYRWDVSQDDWYTELLYQPLVSISMILFCFSVIEEGNERSKILWSRTFAFLYLCLMVALLYNSQPMRDRSAQIQHLTDQLQHQHISKAEIELVNISRPFNNWVWSVPVEALLISAIDGPDQSVSLVSRQDIEYWDSRKKLHQENFLFRKFEILDLQELNPRYFQLRKEDYQKINTDRDLMHLKEMKDSLSIYPNTEDRTLSIPKGMTSWVDISIENKHYRYLPSAIQNNLSIASHWYHADTLHKWDGKRTPLELDIIGTHHQKIQLVAPEEEGIYEVRLDLVKEGEYWLDLEPKYLVQVY